MSDCPSQYIFPTDIDTQDHDVLKSAVSVIVDEYVHLSYPSHKPQNPDHVQEYTRYVNYGIILYGVPGCH